MDQVHGVVHGGPWTGSMRWSMDPSPCFVYVPLPGRKRRQMPGVSPGGGMFKLRFDRYISGRGAVREAGGLMVSALVPTASGPV